MSHLWRHTRWRLLCGLILHTFLYCNSFIFGWIFNNSHTILKIPASGNSVYYKSIPVLDWVPFFLYRLITEKEFFSSFRYRTGIGIPAFLAGMPRKNLLLHYTEPNARVKRSFLYWHSQPLADLFMNDASGLSNEDDDQNDGLNGY